jgi:hypothetical protein
VGVAEGGKSIAGRGSDLDVAAVAWHVERATIDVIVPHT